MEAAPHRGRGGRDGRRGGMEDPREGAGDTVSAPWCAGTPGVGRAGRVASRVASLAKRPLVSPPNLPRSRHPYHDRQRRAGTHDGGVKRRAGGGSGGE